MKKVLFILAVMFALNFNSFAQNATTATEAFGVIELFTSEGCSSCPPAEDYLKQIIEHDSIKGRNVVVMEEHVPYWDYLGWKDNLAKPIFETRQRAYCTQLGSGVYTPMYVINGQVATANANTALTNLYNYSKMASTTSISLTITSGPQESYIDVQYEVIGAAIGSKLNIVLCENEITQKITSGENNGKTLTHKYVARVFTTVTLDALTGTKQITFPTDMVRHNSYLTAFVSDASNLKSLAGTKGLIITPSSGVNDHYNYAEVKISPVPTTNELTVKLDNIYTGLRYTIIDMQGKVVSSGTAGTNSNNFNIDISNLRANLYILKLTSRNGEVLINKSFIKTE